MVGLKRVDGNVLICNVSKLFGLKKDGNYKQCRNLRKKRNKQGAKGGRKDGNLRKGKKEQKDKEEWRKYVNEGEEIKIEMI